MHPKSVDHLFVDMLWLTNLVIVKAESHELIRCHQLKLSTEVRDLSWVQLQDYIEESCSTAFTFIKLLLAEGNCCYKDVRCFDKFLYVSLSLQFSHRVVNRLLC